MHAVRAPLGDPAMNWVKPQDGFHYLQTTPPPKQEKQKTGREREREREKRHKSMGYTTTMHPLNQWYRIRCHLGGGNLEAEGPPVAKAAFRWHFGGASNPLQVCSSGWAWCARQGCVSEIGRLQIRCELGVFFICMGFVSNLERHDHVGFFPSPLFFLANMVRKRVGGGLLSQALTHAFFLPMPLGGSHTFRPRIGRWEWCSKAGRGALLV